MVQNDRLAGVITDNRRASHVAHQVAELMRQRTYQISCGYEDADACEDEYCFMPFHVYEGLSGKYITSVLRAGKMELMIKDHKVALKSDRTSCHHKEANQFRLFIHSAAYVLMHALREDLLRSSELARAQFDTIRLRLLKIGTRIEVGKTFIRFHFPASYPLQPLLCRTAAMLAVLNTS